MAHKFSAFFGGVLAAVLAAPVFGAGDPARGAQAFGACAACHSIKAGEHLTGPSLHNLWGRKAGRAVGFERYSAALKDSGIEWNDKTLDAWLEDPKKFIPKNFMFFPGVKDAQEREHLIAFLKDPGAKVVAPPAGGMMAAPQMENLRGLGAANQVTAIRHCRDSYYVTTADGSTYPFWEFNLRFKTDSSANGPSKGKPVLIEGGMRGDRVFVVFADPTEMSKFIKPRCE